MYGFDVKIKDSFQNAVQRVTDALKTEGFGVLTQIDVQATMKQKLGIEQQPYIILGACNPNLAHRALEIDPNIGLLLPCNVIVREEKNGEVAVTFMDPLAVLDIVKAPEIKPIAQEAFDRLKRASNLLTK